MTLSEEGKRQAEELSRALQWLPITAVYSSPLERALETAEPLARDHGLPVRVRPALTEVDFGDWTGRRLADLAGDPMWEAFNHDRRRACPPAGEPLPEVQRRVVDELLALSRTHAGEVVAIVTHAEPIRCAIAAFDGLTLDQAMHVEIAPTHICTVGVGPALRRVLSVNVQPDAAAA